MKTFFLAIFIITFFSSCAPVLRADLMKQGTVNVNFPEMKENPGPYKGNLYILGGIISKTTATKEGALIEALHVPVDSRGYLRNLIATDGRFLALFPGKFLDPLIFREKREITLAGEFIGTRSGRIDEMEYSFPLFEIREIHLWAERKEYGYYEPYPYWYPPYPYWWHDPWWGPRYYW
jgi:outer membrane lipoprotein